MNIVKGIKRIASVLAAICAVGLFIGFIVKVAPEKFWKIESAILSLSLSVAFGIIVLFSFYGAIRLIGCSALDWSRSQ